MTLDQHVACFGMHEAMEQLPFTVEAYADAGAYGHVGNHLASFSCAVYRFTKGGTVHVGVELNGNGEGPCKGTHKVHILPALLRRRLDVAVGGDPSSGQGPEAGNSQGFDGILFEPGNDFRQHLGCGGGRKPHFRKDTDGAVLHFSHAANNFSTACFYTAD